jgi:hypothetical protein
VVKRVKRLQVLLSNQENCVDKRVPEPLFHYYGKNLGNLNFNWWRMVWVAAAFGVSGRRVFPLLDETFELPS